MTGERLEQLRAILKAYDERTVKAPALSKTGKREADRQRRAGGDRLRNVVQPVLHAYMTELRNAGHEARLEDRADSDDAYPSVALSFTPLARGVSQGALASMLTFKYDPRRGIVVQRDIRASTERGRMISTSVDRGGTIGVDAVSTEWVETKALTFVDAVLKAN
ncbi:MAG TPA: hypothetical protein VGA20_00510 [Gemmatimonadales bacterium]